MQRYLVDTTVLIDISRGLPGFRRALDELNLAGAELGICAVNLAEFCSGVPVGDMAEWDWILREFKYWRISREAAVRAGAYRYSLRRRGVILKLPDALVAGVASTLGATILTDNLRDFQLLDLTARPLRPDPPGGV